MACPTKAVDAKEPPQLPLGAEVGFGWPFHDQAWGLALVLSESLCMRTSSGMCMVEARGPKPKSCKLRSWQVIWPSQAGHRKHDWGGHHARLPLGRSGSYVALGVRPAGRAQQPCDIVSLSFCRLRELRLCRREGCFCWTGWALPRLL